MAHKIHIQSLILAMALLFGFAFALPAFANEDSTSSTTTTSSMHKVKKMKTASSTGEMRKGQKNVDATCMQTAVDTRESALITAIGTFNDSIESGLTARKSALNTAWGLTVVSDRAIALGNTWKAWKTAQQSALKTFKDARKSAWEAFKGTVKTSCKISLPKEEGLSKDGSGSISI